MESIKIKTKYKLKTLLTTTGFLLLLNANDGACCLFRSKKSKSSKDLNPLKGYESGYESEEEIKARPYTDKKRDSSSHFSNNNIASVPGHPISSNNNDKAVKTNYSPVGDSKEKNNASALVGNNITSVPGHSISSNNNDKAVKTNYSPVGDSKEKNNASALVGNNITSVPGHSISSNNNDKAVKTNHSPVGDSKEKKSSSELSDNSTSSTFSDVSLCHNENASIQPSPINLGNSEQNHHRHFLVRIIYKIIFMKH